MGVCEKYKIYILQNGIVLNFIHYLKHIMFRCSLTSFQSNLFLNIVAIPLLSMNLLILYCLLMMTLLDNKISLISIPGLPVETSQSCSSRPQSDLKASASVIQMYSVHGNIRNVQAIRESRIFCS